MNLFIGLAVAVWFGAPLWFPLALRSPRLLCARVHARLGYPRPLPGALLDALCRHLLCRDVSREVVSLFDTRERFFLLIKFVQSFFAGV